LIAELQDAATKIKTLSGLLPICSNCKKNTRYTQKNFSKNKNNTLSQRDCSLKSFDNSNEFGKFAVL
jgi:hypothetical protein